MSDDEEVTEEVADARKTRDLVMAFALRLALRAVEHVEAHAADSSVSYVVLEERFAAGPGVTWEMKAAYGHGHTFVSVNGEPQALDQPAMMHVNAFAQMMMNNSAAFAFSAPRAWIELAVAAADAVPEFAREQR